MSASVPYETATSGAAARDEVIKLLRRMGCEAIGFMDNFDKNSVTLAFDHRGRRVQMEVSARGWAALYLRSKPYNRARHRKTEKDYNAAALAQGMVAVNSILRDWVKGQVTAVECGMMPFEAVFMPHLLMKDGRSLLEHVTDKALLPPPTK